MPKPSASPLMPKWSKCRFSRRNTPVRGSAPVRPEETGHLEAMGRCGELRAAGHPIRLRPHRENGRNGGEPTTQEDTKAIRLPSLVRFGMSSSWTESELMVQL